MLHFDIPILRKQDANTLRIADATAQNSCCLNVTKILYQRPVALLPLNIGRNLPMQFITSDVFLNIFELLIFLLMRHPHSGFTSTLLSCSTSRTPLQTVTTCQYTSLYLLSCAIIHRLHYTITLILNKQKKYLNKTSPLV